MIVEAGLHGVPTIGSSRGGIPEAVGSGGMILRPDDVDAWLQAIETADRTSLGAKAPTGAAPLVRPCLPELAACWAAPGQVCAGRTLDVSGRCDDHRTSTRGDHNGHLGYRTVRE
ncbi:hypothetical protein [Streptomyces sp. NPDC096033]|uniref:hypothetical protein n=1 Tax=Streptomyces sp. NPDC096033 TaxID=3366071 RepID=UPI003813AC6F